jgi:thiol-disulfide isomerase/thioredoxin
VIVVALIVTIVLTVGQTGSTPLEVGTPTVSGEALTILPDTGDDPDLGKAIADVSGADYQGNPVTITKDGKAKVIVLVAHWCSVCQQEVPVITDWLSQTTLPTNVEIVSVSTGVDSNRDNYPPSAWLERENWPVPLIVDDQRGTVAEAFGLRAFPFFVFVDSSGKVVHRQAGGMDASQIQTWVDQLAAG